MLDWNRIDNDRTLQRLVNHLFALECNSPGFIPSSPYIGADGGWDGYYSGYYPPEDESGIWSIQTKWTTKSLQDAVSSLKPRIREELRKAKNNGVDHLRIATNAELTVDQVRGLEESSGGEVTTLRIWHREELARRIDLQPFLRHYFFGLPQYPQLVPSNVYFRETENHLLAVPATKIGKFEGYLGRARSFILSRSKNILLIHSPGGYGKSHLLREIAELAHRTDSGRQVWMVRAGHRRMQDALQDEIVDGRQYVLVFDDADRFLDGIKPLLAFCGHKGPSVKVILALRTSGLQLIRDVIAELRCGELCEEIDISNWSKGDLIQLLRMATEREQVEDEEAIVTVYPNPFLVVWIGKQIIKEPTLDLEKVKKRFVSDMDYETKRCLRHILGPSEAKGFIMTLACIVPFLRGDDSVVAVLSDRFSLETHAVRRAVENLEEAGILRTVGRSLRFNPDMKGDLYLAYELETATDPRSMEKLIETWMPACPGRLLLNLGASTRYADIPALGQVLSELVRTWVRSAESTPGRLRINRLGLIKEICEIVAEDCVDLLYAYLDFGPPTLGDPRLKALGLQGSSPTADDYGPVLSELIRNASIRRHVVEIIEKIETSGIKATYHNYKPAYLIKRSVSPLYNSPRLIIDTLDILAEWLRQPSDARIRLISAGLSEVLAGAHEYAKSRIGRYEFGHKILKDAPEIRNTRQRALDVLSLMITGQPLEATLAGIEVARQVGDATMPGVWEEDLPLSQAIAKERKSLVEQIGQLISPEADFRLLNAIENLFLDWWAQQLPGTHKVAEYLRSFPRVPGYVTFRYFVSPDHVVEDFDSIEQAAPVEGRWKWFVDNIAGKRFDWVPEDFTALVQLLEEEYGTETEIAEFLASLEAKISPHNPWAHPRIITCWVRERPELFLSMRGDSTLWGEVPERFKSEIELAMGYLQEGFIDELAGELLSHPTDVSISRVDIFLRLLETHSVDQSLVHSWISELLEKGSSQARALVISRLRFIFEKSQDLNSMAKLVNTAIAKESELPGWILPGLWAAIRYLLEHVDTIEREVLERLRDSLLEALKGTPKLDWHARELLKFAFDGTDAVIDFMEYRLVKSEQIRGQGAVAQEYEALPLHKIDAIADQIGSFDDYRRIMDKAMGWYEQVPLWESSYLDYVMKPIGSLSDKVSGKSYAQQYIDEQLESNAVGKACAACRLAALNENTIDTLIEVAESAIAAGLAAEAEDLLYDKALPRSGWSWRSSPGEPPPALVTRRRLFEEMCERAKPGQLRALIKRCINALDEEIDEHLRLDEEFFTPRG